MKDKKQGGRFSYLNDYEKDAAGKYVYTGIEYQWKSPRKPALIKIWFFALAAFAAQLAAGFLPGVGMNDHAWLLLPYAAVLIAAGSLVWGSYELTDGGDPIREHAYKKSVEALPLRGLLTAIFSGASLLGELVNFLWHSQFTGTIPGALLYLLLEAVGIACGILLRKTVSGLSWEE
ncbi:MAG: hypothetical protein LUH07_15940 [Lachnospiraceae bacterium]|nr:hypothetical protein [Lachnospiraceae bacterium]